MEESLLTNAGSVPAKRQYNLFDASIILALTTAYVYFCTFQYEKGYCTHFDIPAYLIEPSFNTLLEFGTAIFLTIIFLMNPIGLLLPIFKYSFDNVLKGRIIKMNTVLLILCLVTINTFPWSIKLLLGLLAVIVFANFSSWGIGYLMSIRTKDPLERSHQISRKSKDFNPFSVLDDYVKKDYHLIIIVAFLFPLFLTLYGSGKATSETRFQYVKNHPDLLVIRKYGDLFFCKKVNLKTHNITGTTILIKSTDSNVTLINQTFKSFE